MRLEYVVISAPLTESCLACHDECVASIACRQKLPHEIREVLVELMRACADTCRIAAAAMVSSDAEAGRVAHVCSIVCDACGQALADVPGFSQCAQACFDCGGVCHQFVNSLKVHEA